jgi:hypothetical protein
MTEPRPTWSDYGHPELEGQPIIATMAGPVQVPEFPPEPGTVAMFDARVGGHRGINQEPRS